MQPVSQGIGVDGDTGSRRLGLEVALQESSHRLQDLFAELTQLQYGCDISTDQTAFSTMKYAIPRMVKQGGGSVVNISSLAGIRWSEVPYAGYYASKAAPCHLGRTTALEFADRRVRVNTVLPGLMKIPKVANTPGIADGYGTDGIEAMWEKRAKQVPLGYMGEAWDVAEASVFLASDRAKFITSADMVVDGGMSVKVA